MDVSQRLFRLMRTIAEDKFETISRFIDEGSDLLDEQLRSWEDEFDLNSDDSFEEKQRQAHHQEKSETVQTDKGSQLEDDLQLFGLQPPSNLETVRQVRNRELKKFHPDKYLGQPEKLETAKQIVQIYNTAYDRLKRYYNNGS